MSRREAQPDRGRRSPHGPRCARSTAKHAAPGHRRSWLIALGLLVLALAVRSTRVTESLWYDEIAAWRDYGSKGPAWIVTHYFDPANHIGHTLASWASFAMLDRLGVVAPEIALRLPALIFSLGSIIAVWGMARCAVRQANPPAEPGANGRRRGVAIIAGLLTAILPVSVLEGVEARGYSMMICFAALATWTMLSAIERGRWWKWLLYAVLCALGMWSHLMMVWVPIGHAVWLIWVMARGSALETRARTGALRGLGAIALAAVLTFALYAPVLDDILRIRGQFRTAEGDEPAVFGVEGLHLLLQLGGSWYWWAAAAGVALCVGGLVMGMRRATPQAAIVLSLIGLPIMVIALAIGGSWMYARFALFALPGTILAMAIGIDGLWRWKRSIGAAALAIIIACSAADLVVRPARQPLREAANIVLSDWTDADRLLVIGLKHEVVQAYAADLAPTYSLDLGADLELKLAEARPTWVIVLYPQRVGEAKLERLADDGLAEVAHLPGWVDWGGGDVSVWRAAGRS